MIFDLSRLLDAGVGVAIVLTVIFTELIKKLDKNDRLKGYRVWIPAILSLVFSAVMAFGEFFILQQVPFYAAVIFGVSVFCYEAILKRFRSDSGNDRRDYDAGEINLNET